MKKLITAALALLTVFGFASCSNPAPEPGSFPDESRVVVIKKDETSAPTQATIGIKEEIVEKATRASVTEPSDSTEPTEAAEKTKKKKKKTSQLPTQGDVNPNAENIEVTAIPLGRLSKSDFDFLIDGAYISLDDEIDDMLAIAGDDNAVTELSDEYLEYDYDGVRFITYMIDDIEKVDEIIVTSDEYPTEKGAAVGMYATQLRRFYGEASEKTETEYIFTSGGKSLIFSVTDNIVTEIHYKLKH